MQNGFILRTLLLFLVLISLSCQSDERCGSGDYMCFDIKSTLPSESPVYFDYYAKAILYSDGNLELFDNIQNFNSPTRANLKTLCSCDAIVDIAFFDQFTPNRNQVDHDDCQDFTNDPCVFILSRENCYRWNTLDNTVFDYSGTGLDSVGLIDASSLVADCSGNIYIADVGGSSVKQFSYNGTFIYEIIDLNQPDNIRIAGDYLYILNRDNNSIARYSRYGNFNSLIVNSGLFDDILCFDIGTDSTIWISHASGKTLSRVDFSSKILEEKRDYCYFDVSFLFNSVVHISCYDNIFIEGGLYVVDNDANYLISLEEFYYH